MPFKVIDFGTNRRLI